MEYKFKEFEGSRINEIKENSWVIFFFKNGLVVSGIFEVLMDGCCAILDNHNSVHNTRVLQLDGLEYCLVSIKAF